MSSKPKSNPRSMHKAGAVPIDIGVLSDLPGTWVSQGLGFNLVALPYMSEENPGGRRLSYRVLMSQYKEELTFRLVTAKVMNRAEPADGGLGSTDQTIDAVDYLQIINQLNGTDVPESGKAGAPGDLIHNETGQWLYMEDETVDGFDIARLSSIPHGDAVCAVGKSSHYPKGPRIDEPHDRGPSRLNALPIGHTNPESLDNTYLAPYKHFVDHPYLAERVPGMPAAFKGFNPLDANELLRLIAAEGGVAKTTQLTVDSTVIGAGIGNIPFITKNADASSMQCSFWIQEMKEKVDGKPKMRLQYSQAVMLDFRDRKDQLPGKIQWPHISINTLEKISDTVPDDPGAAIGSAPS